MSNSYFQFKQFLVEQDKCAMKVSTDACIQGAWTTINQNIKQVLDIGTGTGLLALMLAQKNGDVKIDAVEYDGNAAQQATENFTASPWQERLSCINSDINNFTTHKKYGLIVSNPPFFKDSLLGPTHERNIARHSMTLTLEDLIRIANNLLNDDGCISLLLPPTIQKNWELLIENIGWYISNKLYIIPSYNKEANRIVSITSKKVVTTLHEERLVIRDSKNEYSNDFKQLLHDYYLHL